jgi:hypothetical protein
MTETRMETIPSIISGMIVLLLVTTVGFSTAVFVTRNDNGTNTNQTTSSNASGSFTNDYTRSITPSTINIGSHPSAAESKGGHNSIRVISVNAHTSIPAGGQNGVTAKCPPGYVVTGGGFAGSGAPGVFVYQSLPDGVPPTGWFVGAFNTTPDNEAITAIAMCAR